MAPPVQNRRPCSCAQKRHCPPTKPVNLALSRLGGVSPYRQHPCRVLHLLWVRLHISVIKCAPIVHIDFMLVPQMSNERSDIPCHGTLRAGIRAVVWPKRTLGLVLQLAVVGEYVWTSQILVSARKLKRLCHFLQR